MSLGGTPQARGNRGGRRIKVLWVQAASDSYIYTFRGFSISRFVERVRARGVNATPLQITVPGEDLYLSEVAELAWSTWLEIGWLVTGYQKFHAYRRLLLRSRTRACHFSFAPRDLISQPDMEWAVSNTHEQRPTSPLVFENPRVSDCAANQIYFTCSLLKLFILYFGLIFFFFVLLSQFLTGFFPGNWREDIITIFLIFDLILTKQIWLFIYEGMTRNNTGNTRSRCREEYQILHRTIELFPCTLHGVPEETNPWTRHEPRKNQPLLSFLKKETRTCVVWLVVFRYNRTRGRGYESLLIASDVSYTVLVP